MDSYRCDSCELTFSIEEPRNAEPEFCPGCGDEVRKLERLAIL